MNVIVNDDDMLDSSSDSTDGECSDSGNKVQIKSKK
jgi:hypothetical protein